MVYGPPGVGKTTLMGSGVNDDRIWPMLIMDYEGGTIAIDSLVNRVSLEDFIAGEITPTSGKIDVIQPTSLADISKVYAYLGNKPNPYKALVIDSLSEINQLALMSATGNDKKATTTALTDVTMPQIKDYGNTATMLRTLVRALRNLSLHRFYVCGAKTGDNPATQLQQLMPALVGQLTLDIPAIVTVVGFLRVYEVVDEEGKPVTDENDKQMTVRVLHTEGTDRLVAKDRTERGKLGGEIENPTLTTVMDLLGYEHTAAKSETTKTSKKEK
jgi:hypothetical protein